MTASLTLRSPLALGPGAVLVAFVGLSLGSTIATATGSFGPVLAFWRFLIRAVLWHGILAITGARTGAARRHSRLAGRRGARDRVRREPLPLLLRRQAHGGLSPGGWALVGVLAVTAGMVSPGLIAWAQSVVPVSTISMLQLAQPGLGVLWAAIFLGERVAPIQLAGMAIVLGAVGTIARLSAGAAQPEVSSNPRWTLRSNCSS